MKWAQRKITDHNWFEFPNFIKGKVTATLIYCLRCFSILIGDWVCLHWYGCLVACVRIPWRAFVCGCTCISKRQHTILLLVCCCFYLLTATDFEINWCEIHPQHTHKHKHRHQPRMKRKHTCWYWYDVLHFIQRSICQCIERIFANNAKSKQIFFFAKWQMTESERFKNPPDE